MSEAPGLSLGAALAVATATGAALCLTRDSARQRLFLGGNFPRELFGVLHGDLLSEVERSM